MIYGPFAPRYGAGQTVATSTSSATTTIGLGNKCLRLQNTDGTNTLHVRVSVGTSTATTADLMLRPNQVIVIQKDQNADTVAHIAAAGTPNLRIEPGEAGI
jgi:hypothetical protein